MHAAQSVVGKRAATQFFVSSYTPTLEALIVAPSSNIVTTADPKVVVVVQSAAEGFSTLEFAKKEYARIRDVVPIKYMLNVDGTRPNPNNGTTPVLEKEGRATIQRVLDRLDDASIVHFVCHGIQDEASPLDSALMLSDGKLTISKMQSVRRTSPASLAFLSACESAMGDPSQPDEVIHMAAAMLSIGFRSTVATMWCVPSFLFITRSGLIDKQANG